MYKKDLDIENPKKFQRHVSDIASNVLFKRGYYLNKKYTKVPYLNANGIINTADFFGVLCYVKNHQNYNLLLRILGICLIIFSVIYWISPIFQYDIFHFQWINVPAWIIIGIGVFLIIFKFGKDICIEVKLVGECYRTDVIQNEKSIEYLGVRSTARLTINAITLDPTKTLSDKDIQKLREDGAELTSEITPFLEKFLEKKES